MATTAVGFDGFEAAPIGLLVVNRDAVVERANSEACRLISQNGGASPEGEKLAETFADRFAIAIADRIEASITSGAENSLLAAFKLGGAQIELRFAAGDGSRCAVSLARVGGTSEAEQRLRAHFTRSPLASIEWRLDRSVKLWNPAAEGIFGYTAEEAESMDMFSALVAPESRATVDRVWTELLSASGGEMVTNTNLTRDGRTILCRWYNTPLLDPEGNVVGVSSLAEDVTERALADRKLRESERRLRSIIDRLPVLVWAIDENHRPVFWNDHAQRVSGLKPEDVLCSDGAAKLFPADALDLEAFLGLDFDAVERPLRCADKSIRRVLWSNVAARCPVPGWLAWGMGIDVTELQQARRAALESERRFKDVFYSVELAGVLLDPDGLVQDCNRAMLSALECSRDEIIGADWFEVGCPDDMRDDARAQLKSALATGIYDQRTERRIVSKQGRTREMIWTRSLLRDADGRPVAACAFGLDVTDRRRAEAELAEHRDQLERLVEERTLALAQSTKQLAEAERLASIGQLAAGVGHDINNILLPVRCHLDALNEHEDPSVNDAVSAVSTGLTVLARMGESLRRMTPAQSTDDHAREHGRRESKVIELTDWWADAGPLVTGAVPAPISFKVELPAGVQAVAGDEHELTQAVINLVLNAVDAIDDADRGEILMRIRADGAAASITITDNGRGMSEVVARRASEPFFSTKTRGISTGLGLSVVDAFVKAAGGRKVVESTLGKGTTVTMLLPRPNTGGLGSYAPDRGAVLVRIADPRTKAIHESVLIDLGFTVLGPNNDRNQVDILVHDGPETHNDVSSRHVYRVVSNPDSANPYDIDVRSGLAELRLIYSRSAVS